MTTDRQRKTLKNMVENGGKLSPAMKKAGYSDAYAKNPHKLRKTEGFQKLIDEYIPEKDVARVHKKLLQKREVRVIEIDGEVTEKEVKRIGNRVSLSKADFWYSRQQRKKFGKNGKVLYEYSVWMLSYVVPADAAVSRALDMAYKIRGSYSPEKVEVQNSLKDLSDDELEALYFELKKEEGANTPKKRTKKRSNNRVGKPAAKRKV